MKEKIAIIGASELQNPLILKAKEKGYETHVFAWKSGDIGEITADKYYPISIVEKEKILSELKRINPVAVASIASDLAVITVNYIAEKLNLVGNSIHATEISTNKYKMREALENINLKVPHYFLIDDTSRLSNMKLIYPLIVKPTDRSGSRGVKKVYNYDDLVNAVGFANQQSFEKKVIVEEFVKGKEYSVEFVSFKEEHHFLAITEKVTTGEPYYIEVAHIQPAQVPGTVKQEVIGVIKKALTALGIQFGASHSEVIITEEGEIFIIEIGPRMGGDCIGSDMVEISTGYDFVSMIIDIACGKELKLEKKARSGFAFVRYLFSEEDFEKLDHVKENYPELIWKIGNINKFDRRVIRDSSERYGFYILNCKSMEQGLNLIK
jgi:biotin carboxylase